MKKLIYSEIDLSQMDIDEIEDAGYKLADIVEVFKVNVPLHYFRNQMTKKYGPGTKVYKTQSEVTGQDFYEVYARI